MIKQTTAAALAGVLAMSLLPSQVQAQSAPVAPPSGPSMPGLCFLFKDELLGTSTVGKFVSSRLQQLGQQVEAELNAQNSSLQNDAKALEAQRATLSQQQLQERAAALGTRQQNLEREVALRRQEMSATEQKALQRISTEADPIVRQVFQQRGCSVLLDGAAILLPSSSTIDITPAVVTGLNSKITQFTFDREHLDQSAAAQR
ncbi:MAG TPA: OmpH family outer membrane protein [Caulobacteraceae bacterium]|nr:OmpH family outer membrane protein [Caulobacteraceae bacterium]